MSSEGIDVEFGDRSYRVVPQRVGRIRRKLSAALGLLDGSAAGGEVDDQLYEALRVFIPDLAPKHKLMGYASEETMAADDYDEAADASPTGPQIADAVAAIYKVNGGERITRLLGNLVSPDLVRAFIRTEGLRELSRRSASSPSLPDGARSTSSAPPSPTPKSEGSPSLASSTS